jgi:hypothetical protein
MGAMCRHFGIETRAVSAGPVSARDRYQDRCRMRSAHAASALA